MTLATVQGRLASVSGASAEIHAYAVRRVWHARAIQSAGSVTVELAHVTGIDLDAAMVALLWPQSEKPA